MDRIERGMAGDAVVEVNVYIPRKLWRLLLRDLYGVAWFAALLPGFDAARPAVEHFVGVVADVQTLDVQPDVKKVGGNVFGKGKFAAGVRDREGVITASQQLDELCGEKAFVPRLEGVSQFDIRNFLGPRL